MVTMIRVYKIYPPNEERCIAKEAESFFKAAWFGFKYFGDVEYVTVKEHGFDSEVQFSRKELLDIPKWLLVCFGNGGEYQETEVAFSPSAQMACDVARQLINDRQLAWVEIYKVEKPEDGRPSLTFVEEIM